MQNVIYVSMGMEMNEVTNHYTKVTCNRPKKKTDEMIKDSCEIIYKGNLIIDVIFSNLNTLSLEHTLESSVLH